MEIIKSSNDRREFRYIGLPNGLEALLISDPLTQKAAASLSVSIGSYYDTVDGIAHFLEHMLFMGSSKYPDENEYSQIVTENGGYSNAYTTSDHTNYYFTCTPDGLFNVLDVFAQFFISPLLKKDSVQREINAVDSEYKNGLTNDAWRFHGVKREFMNDSHPMHKFNVGSTSTLNIPNVREIVMDFYNTYYSSDLMKLVVVGKQTLDELENSVTTMFSAVPKHKVVTKTEFGFMYNAPVYGHIVPMKDENKLDVIWEFQLSDDYAMFHIDEFISHVIGHEGPGSLFDILYQRFLANSLIAGVEQSSKNHKALFITIHLTDMGFQKINLVRQFVLSYVNMFSQSTYESFLNLYNELKMINETKFKNYTIENADTTATQTSAFWATHNVKPEHLISHPYIFNDYTPAVHNIISNILSNMTNNNSITFVRSKSFDSDQCQIDNWYNVKHIKYNTIPHFPNENLNTSLTLPHQNQYIFDKMTRMIDDVADEPIRLNLDNVDLYWKPDVTYNTQNVYFKLNVILPTKNQTIKDAILGKIFFGCFDHSSNAETYNINCANYEALLTPSKNGMTIYINGHPEKFMNVLRVLIDSFLNLKITTEMFENVKTNYKQRLKNFLLTQPYSLIDYHLSTHIERNVYPINELLNTLDTITFDDILNYDSLGNPIIAYGLIQGNISSADALKIGEYVRKLNPSNTKYIPTEYFKQIDTCEFSDNVENPTEPNSCYKLSIKIGYLRPDINKQYIEMSSCLDILNGIIKEQFFDQLRTKEQLGYVVQSYKSSYGNRQEQPFITYDFCVQSPHKDANYLKDRTVRFIKEFRDHLTQKSDEAINKLIQSQILTLEAPFQNLDTASSFNLTAISQQCCNFNIRNDKISFIKTINKTDLINFYDKYFSLTNGTYWSIMLNRRTL